eukprot:487259_1
MVDISQDIEWDQNFEFDQKLQTKLNNDEDSSSSQPPSTNDNEEINHKPSHEEGTHENNGNVPPQYDDDNDSIDPNRKRVRRPSNAELIDRVIQQQNDEDDETKEEVLPNNTPNKPEINIDKQNVSESTSPHAKEGDESERDRFYEYEKHVFIVTWGGRPLYTRHGSLNDKHMTSFMGVVSLFPSNVERVNVLTQDEIRCFSTYDGVQFIYLLCGPLYLFCVTRTRESIHQIRNQMRYYQLLIVMTLTNVFERTLTQSPQFDMRSIFGPTDYMLLSKLVSDTDRSPTYLFDSYYPAQILKQTRDEIGAVMKQCKRDQSQKGNKLLYSLLFVNGTVVTCTQPKKRPLHHEDIVLMSHFVSNSKSWKQSEAFTPICLPHFEASGFVYCYVSYFGKISGCSEQNKEICIVILTLDASSFKKCQLLRKAIEHHLMQKGLVEVIKASAKLYPAKTSHIVSKMLNIMTPQIYVFYYNNLRKNQYIAPDPIKLYNTPPGKKSLFRRLQHLHHHVHSTPHHQNYFERSSNDAACCTFVPNQCELYVLCNSFVSKKDAQNVTERLLNWININEPNLTVNNVNW